MTVTPENCRWATWTEQQRNKSDSFKVEWEGKSCALIDLSEEYGVAFATVKGRLKRGWSLERALTTATKQIQVLNADDVKRIRESLSSGVPTKTLAERYGVSAKHVRAIGAGRRYRASYSR